MDIGKYFEKKVQDILKELQAEYPCTFYRFPDATAARNSMTAQPGDHMLLFNGRALLIEEKASEVHESLVSCAANMIKKKQAAMHLKWARSGNESIYLFYSRITGNVELWDGEYVATQRASGNKLVEGKPHSINFSIKRLKIILLEIMEATE